MVAYAPLADNLSQALAEYTETDRAEKPVGRNIDEAADLTRTLIETLDEICAGYHVAQPSHGDTQELDQGCRRADQLPALTRDAGKPAVQRRGDARRAVPQAGKPARASVGARCRERRRSTTCGPSVKFYEEVRVWMGKFDAQERQASGEPVPEEIQRLLSSARRVLDRDWRDRRHLRRCGPTQAVAVGARARIPAQGTEGREPTPRDRGLARPAHRGSREGDAQQPGPAQRAFSERIKELMNRYTNQQLTSAEVIAELIEMAKEVAAEADRGKHFIPALSEDELAFYDAVSANESAVELQGEDVLAQIARDLVAVMRRDTKTDWMVRDDVRAKLRSSVKRLLVKYKYPPDRQPDAIKLVIEQMETMAPRYAA